VLLASTRYREPVTLCAAPRKVNLIGISLTITNPRAKRVLGFYCIDHTIILKIVVIVVIMVADIRRPLMKLDDVKLIGVIGGGLMAS
jgi:hypothetical protein